jgi:hypothetical protein
MLIIDDAHDVHLPPHTCHFGDRQHLLRIVDASDPGRNTEAHGGSIIGFIQCGR